MVFSKGLKTSSLLQEKNRKTVKTQTIIFIYFLNSAVFFLVRKFYMLRCLFGALYVDMRCFGVFGVFSKHTPPTQTNGEV